MRAKKRGLPQLGTLGAGNHYVEIQVVEEIYDAHAAQKMGINRKGQVVIMIHSGSRGLGHQVATDALVAMEKAMDRDGIKVEDRQLACARIQSEEGQNYLKAMAAAANYAWVNRSSMTYLVRLAFAKKFNKDPEELDMHVIYDVSHNIAKVEEHMIDGHIKKLLVHRKGSTRAFPPHHPLIPVDYQLTGQPVLIGGTMGTCSFVLTGTDKGMAETFGSTCHGAGRALSRSKARRTLEYQDVLNSLAAKGIAINVASPKLVMEEAPESYKDVIQVSWRELSGQRVKAGKRRFSPTNRPCVCAMLGLARWWTRAIKPALARRRLSFDPLRLLKDEDGHGHEGVALGPRSMLTLKIALLCMHTKRK